MMSGSTSRVVVAEGVRVTLLPSSMATPAGFAVSERERADKGCTGVDEVEEESLLSSEWEVEAELEDEEVDNE